MNIYDTYIDDILKTHINTLFDDTCEFKQIITYCTANGKRIRPKIAIDVCNTISNGKIICGTSALAIEYIHTASLIIDDLPCMDNARTRRGQDCVHIKYSEAIAQLTSALLLSMSMNAISTDLKRMLSSGTLTEQSVFKIGLFLFDNFSSILGYSGAVGGQLLDLSTSKVDIGILLKNASKNMSVNEIIEKKLGNSSKLRF